MNALMDHARKQTLQLCPEYLTDDDRFILMKSDPYFYYQTGIFADYLVDLGWHFSGMKELRIQYIIPSVEKLPESIPLGFFLLENSGYGKELYTMRKDKRYREKLMENSQQE